MLSFVSQEDYSKKKKKKLGHRSLFNLSTMKEAIKLFHSIVIPHLDPGIGSHRQLCFYLSGNYLYFQTQVIKSGVFFNGGFHKSESITL